MLVIAHRGASALVQENTLASFSLAQKLGSTWFETDIQRTKDGVLVLYHDYLLPSSKHIKGLNYSTLRKINIPTLKELLEQTSQDITLNLEIKNDDNLYKGIEGEIAALLNQKIFKGEILISSFDYPTLVRMKTLCPTLKYGVLTRKFNLQENLSLNSYSVHISVKRVTPQIIKTCHRAGLKVFIYTVNDYKTYLALEQMGADGVFSNIPYISCPHFTSLGLSI